jgi:hypothetical protein
MPRNTSRRAMCGGIAVAVLVWWGPAWAGSYLNRAALLILESRAEADILRKHLSDQELARVVLEICEGRLEAARGMFVPPEVRLAHPHLVIMLERYALAADAAVRGKPENFLSIEREARDEEQIFRSIVKQLGWDLPNL